MNKCSKWGTPQQQQQQLIWFQSNFIHQNINTGELQLKL